MRAESRLRRAEAMVSVLERRDECEVLPDERLGPDQFAESVGLIPDSWQADVLTTPRDRIILNCCRQSGKSSITGILALYTALYESPALVLLLSPSLRQSSELFRKVLTLYGKVAGAFPSRAESALRLELMNGSRIVSLPGNETTVRGYSGVDLLAVDEAARVTDDLYCSVRPMLAVSGGRLVLLSTPFGKQGFFYDTWSEEGDEWLRVRVTAEECPRIPPEFLEEERRTLGPWWFAQEYFCEFEDSVAAVFGGEEIREAFSQEVEQWAI